METPLWVGGRCVKKKEGSPTASVAKSVARGVATVKRKAGGQPGNINSVGNRGNPNPVHPDATKHGGYRAVLLDALDDDEAEMVKALSFDEEIMLMEEIQVLTVEEYRLLKAINKYRDDEIKTAESGGIEYEDKNGNLSARETHTENKDLTMARLQQELSTVHNRKIKAIDNLHKLRTEKAKAEIDGAGSGVVDDWIAGIMGGGGA